MLELDPYQEFGADWLANGTPVLYLADQMRVGKTPQVAVAAARINARRVLVVCPGIARVNWLHHFRDYCPDQGFADHAVLIYGKRDIREITEETRLIIVSYDLARGSALSTLYAHSMTFGLDLLVLDEAHYLTNNLADRTRAILGPKCTGENAIAGLASRTWWLSGTPMRGNPSHLFPFMRQAGLWSKSKTDLINQFCFGHHNGIEFVITGAKNLSALRPMLEPYTLRRLRSDLAPETISVETVTIEPREIDPTSPILDILAVQDATCAAVIRQHMKDGTLSGIDRPYLRRDGKQGKGRGTKRRGDISTLRRLVGLAKVAGTVELIENILADDDDAKVAVFGQHRDPLRFLRASLRPSCKPALVLGGMDPRKRDNLVTSFQINPHRRVFIANIHSAGTAIDLSAADTAIIFEPSWTPIDNAQAIARVLNIRNPSPKQVIFVGLANSIDDDVTRVCERKARDIKGLYSAV